jgi:hypothetical protein
LEARAALELRTKKETQSEEGIQEQADPVAEDNGWEEDGGDSSGVLSVKSTVISLDYLTKHAHFTGSANATYDRPRKRQRTEAHSSASSDGSELGISMGLRVHLQSQSETDPCGMNR